MISPEYPTPLPAHYTPSPEKLAGLGFASIRSENGAALYSRPRQEHNPDRHDVERICVVNRPPYPPKLILEGAMSGADRGANFFRGAVRSEADFDRLLWQIGWTEEEPVNEAELRRITQQ